VVSDTSWIPGQARNDGKGKYAKFSLKHILNCSRKTDNIKVVFTALCLLRLLGMQLDSEIKVMYNTLANIQVARLKTVRKKRGIRRILKPCLLREATVSSTT
jgi:hypothetical protein